jgi:hypothetical protein
MMKTDDRIFVALRAIVTCSALLFAPLMPCAAMSVESSASAFEIWGRAFSADTNRDDPLRAAELYLEAMSQDVIPPHIFLNFEDAWCGGPPFFGPDRDVIESRWNAIVNRMMATKEFVDLASSYSWLGDVPSEDQCGLMAIIADATDVAGWQRLSLSEDPRIAARGLSRLKVIAPVDAATWLIACRSAIENGDDTEWWGALAALGSSSEYRQYDPVPEGDVPAFKAGYYLEAMQRTGGGKEVKSLRIALFESRSSFISSQKWVKVLLSVWRRINEDLDSVVDTQQMCVLASAISNLARLAVESHHGHDDRSETIVYVTLVKRLSMALRDRATRQQSLSDYSDRLFDVLVDNVLPDEDEKATRLQAASREGDVAIVAAVTEMGNRQIAFLHTIPRFELR